jgi:uncharacterized repeat protein (TIGR04076 family)
MTWTAYIDGGARGNPGPAAAGIHILDDGGKPVFSAGLFLGHKTNNEAEYAGLLFTLDLLLAAGINDVQIRSDSELLVRQMQGQYRVKAPNLQPLFEKAMDRLMDIKKARFQHVRREENREADALVNQALDAVADVIAVDRDGLADSLKRPRIAAAPSATRTAGKAAPPTGGIVVSVVKAPKPGTCPAGLKAAQTYRFGTTTPPGFCTEGCAAVIDAVLSLQSAIQEGEKDLSPMTITCGRPGCGAVFQLKQG